MFIQEAANRHVYFKPLDLEIRETSYEIDRTSQSTGTKVIGRAYRDERYIQIDSLYFHRSGYLSQEHLIFHELGHYLLQRHHTYIKDDDGNPSSIMYKFDFAYGTNKREELRDYYLDELFANF